MKVPKLKMSAKKCLITSASLFLSLGIASYGYADCKNVSVTAQAKGSTQPRSASIGVLGEGKTITAESIQNNKNGKRYVCTVTKECVQGGGVLTTKTVGCS